MNFLNSVVAISTIPILEIAKVMPQPVHMALEEKVHNRGGTRAGLRGRQSRQPPRAPGFRGLPNAKNRAPVCNYQKIEIP